MWPALRERPSPTFMRDSPAAASGTRQIKKRQAAVVVSVSLGAIMEIIFFPLAESDETGKQGPIPAPPRQCRPGQTRLATAATRKARSQPARATTPPAASGNP